jgi:hypothetical protein
VVFGPGAERAGETLASRNAAAAAAAEPRHSGLGGFTVSLVVMVAVSVAAAVMAASDPLAPRKAEPCSPP